MPVFPTELTDEIIACIPVVCSGTRERYPTLLCCSLVCSAWLPASRHQLFQELYIDTPVRYDLLVSRVLHSEEMRLYLPSVRTVQLKIPDSPPFNRRPFMLEFAGHLPSVTDMHMSRTALGAWISHPSSFVAISRFSSTQSLMIFRCAFPSFGALRRILTSLPSLTILRLDDPSWPDPAADLSPRLSHGASIVRRPALSVLAASWGSHSPDQRRAQQFMNWLSETATASSLVDLRVSKHPETAQIGCMETFGPSLVRFGRAVRRLDIEVGESRDPKLERFLCSLTSLEALHLRFDSLRLQPDAWVQIASLMHSVPRRTKLLDLYIKFHYSGPPELSNLDGLEALDAALQPELFDDLQAVKLHLFYTEVSTNPQERVRTEPMLAVFKTKLSKLYERSTIEVSADEGYSYTVSVGPQPVVDVEPPTDHNTALS
ncbi:hypothetical protein K466DRAFT_605639 [Polyporus arcularius HHB13444]|uniref:F-box domain-containing protein n=1 Tax=Polyporus arcularius HHB13444 TaxID=1314778 RepID=A0A5C3P2U4_9APHY|nr:hypothetical protein K466DRAFT_605639 [Polyporus arcularius HHB13444]